MVPSPASSVTRYGIALSMLCGLTVPTWTAAQVVGTGEPLYEFDIPAQSLSVALGRYADVSGQSTVFSSEMVAGRTSSAVDGRYSAGDALRHLLAGSGLIAQQHHSGLGDIFLLQVDDTPAASATDIDARVHRGAYPGLLQTRVWQALCADARTAPGNYRILFRFRIDQNGRLADAQLLSSSGNAARDFALLEVVQRVQLEAPPPAVLAQQDLTMLLLPEDANGRHNGPECHREAH